MRGSSLYKPRLSALAFALTTIFLFGILVIFNGCGKEKTFIRYKDRPLPISLISPAIDTFITVNTPTFVWQNSIDAVRYQLQVAMLSDFVIKSIDIQTSDTSHTALHSLLNSTFYWRVRGQNANGEWGDWSDATIWRFVKSDYLNFFKLLSQTSTYGIAQDVYLRNDTAYVADGQADLTIFDVSNPANPTIIRDLELSNDDFAKGVYVAPTTFTYDHYPYAFVADMDGRIQALNTGDTTGIGILQPFGTDQNLEDLTGIIRADTLNPDSSSLWILAVSSGYGRRKLAFYNFQFAPGPQQVYSYPINMPADAMGVCADSNYAYVACGTAGLIIVNIQDIYNPTIVSSLALGGTSLSVDVNGNYAYVSADRAGLFVVDITNRNSPRIAHEVNTTGRSKDVQAVGNYAFVADANLGLSVVDVSVADSSHLVASYATPYAYGVYATSDYIYICDRDLGFLIFENRTSR